MMVQGVCIRHKMGHLQQVPAQVGEHGSLQLLTADLLSQTQIGTAVVWAEFTLQNWQALGEEGLCHEIAAELQVGRNKQTFREWQWSPHKLTHSLYLDVCVQLFHRDNKPVAEGELKEMVEDRGGHVIQLDEALWGLSHSRLWQGSEILAALRQSEEVHLKGRVHPKEEMNQRSWSCGLG